MVMAWAPSGLGELPVWMEQRRLCEAELSNRPAAHTAAPRPGTSTTSATLHEDAREWLDALARRLRVLQGDLSLRQIARSCDNSVSLGTLSDALAGRRLPSPNTISTLMAAMDVPVDASNEVWALWQEARDRINGHESPDPLHEPDYATLDPSVAAKHVMDLVDTYRWSGAIRRLVRMQPGPAAGVLGLMPPRIVTDLLKEMHPRDAAKLVKAAPEFFAARLLEMDVKLAVLRLYDIEYWERTTVLRYMSTQQAAAILTEFRDPAGIADILSASYDNEWIDCVLTAMNPALRTSVGESLRHGWR
jgi:hypothetical protein